MAQTTTYTCDRCGYETTRNDGWESVKHSYYSKDYCPTCVKQLLTIGLEAEESNKAKKESQKAAIPY